MWRASALPAPYCPLFYTRAKTAPLQPLPAELETAPGLASPGASSMGCGNTKQVEPAAPEPGSVAFRDS